MKIIVVIPAYNEAATIRPLAEAILQQGLGLIVVDDASQEGTSDQLIDLPLTLIRHEKNQGKAASLSDGMDVALAQGADGILTLDGDGQHRPEDIPKLISVFSEKPNQLVIGARLLKREQAPKARRRANDFADFWISWAAGQRIFDSQSGFRLYPARAVAQIDIDYNRERGFVFESEFLIEASRQGFGIRTVPLTSHYPNQARLSHFRPVVDISRIVLMVAGRLIRSGFNPLGLVRIIRRSA
jgi:glycosyltransferase involved in cell wall biosynthesis